MKYDFSEFLNLCADLNLSPTDHQVEQFLRYYELLTEWNEKMNLTAITEFQDVIEKHFVDSLSIVRVDYFLRCLPQSLSIIDVGTGAGFPGIPLKIMFPHCHVTLLDSLQKRLNFLDVVIGELGLESIETVHGRAEDLGRDPAYRESYDFCVSRAVANLNTLSELCLPFVKVGGSFIPYKGDKGMEELNEAKGAIHLLGGEIRQRCSYQFSDYNRVLAEIRKLGFCPDKYPRQAGIPAKKPLK